MKNTKYQRLYENLILQIRSGSLGSGEFLPSTRELARLHRCHRFTVMSVCQDLVAEGWIDSSPRSRYKVSAKTPVTSSESSAKKTGGKKTVSIMARPLPQIDLKRSSYALEFWGGQPDLRLFPKDEFRRVLSAGLRRLKPDQMNYGLTDGTESCLKEVSHYLRRSRNLIHKELVMTNGSQEALLLISQAFVKPGEKIAVERKGYPSAWRLFESLGAILIPIEVDEQGIDTEDLERKLKKHQIKMIYTTPLHQYPTTVTLSPRRRQSLIRLAEQKSIPILEDDYDHEFHYIGPPPAPLSTETDLGIYICSFSKLLFPGARLGVVACNAKIKNYISSQKYLVSRQTDCLSQVGLSAWMKDGGFERHLRRMRRAYEARYFFMIDQLQRIQKKAEISWDSPSGGMSIWVDLHRDSKLIAEKSKKRGVFFQHESHMDYLPSVGTHLRIGFAGVNEKEIENGFKILSDLL